jgi:hypothetical protein
VSVKTVGLLSCVEPGCAQTWAVLPGQLAGCDSADLAQDTDAIGRAADDRQQ